MIDCISEPLAAEGEATKPVTTKDTLRFEDSSLYLPAPKCYLHFVDTC